MRALLAQLASIPGAVDENLTRLESLLAEHAGAQLAVFPELYLQAYLPRRARESACAADGEELGRLRAAAARSQTALVVGFAERTRSGRLANSAACIDSDGLLAGVHRKTQLFGDVEREVFEAGESLLLAELQERRVAPQICFEVEFPEPARRLALAGADLLVTIAANMTPYGAEQELAVRARALENRLPHLYVNGVGSYGELELVGGSCAIDCHGQAIASAGEGEQLLEVEVPAGWNAGGDIDYLNHIRFNLPVQVAASHTGGGGSR